MMHDYSLAFIGGTLLGISVVGYLYVNGGIAGISGLLAQILNPETIFKTSALYFLLGLLIVPFMYHWMVMPQIQINISPMALIIAGIFVGVGTRMGSGCTSGHGICGISRLSRRSIVATITFMFTAMITVYLMRHVIGA